MGRNWIIVASTVLVLLVIVFLSFHLHHLSERHVLSQFQEHQLSHVQNLADQIRSFFEWRARGLRILSSFESLRYGNLERKKTDILAYFKQMEKEHVEEISLYDDVGTIIYSTDTHSIGLNHRQSEFFGWAKKKEANGKVFISQIPPFGDTKERESSSFRFLLAMPIYQGSSDAKDSKPSGKFVGVLSFGIGLKEFLADQLVFLDPAVSLHQVWIMDKSGRLLFQSEHQEMVLRNIFRRDKSCLECHISFDYAEKILRERKGIAEYQVRHSPKKAAAFAPMDFENVSWVAVVNTPYDEVTAFSRESLREHLILLGMVVLAFVVGFTLLIHNDRLKVRAEEESKRWQEKIAERNRAEGVLQRERDKFKSILDAMNDGVYIVDQGHEIQYLNPVIEKELGPVNGRKCHEYLQGLSEACSWCKNQEVFSGKSVGREWYSFKTGKTYDLFETPIMNVDGTISKLKIFHDITGRKQAEKALLESEERYRTLVETMNDGLGVQDQNGLWTYANERLCKMLGYRRDEIIGHPVIDFIDTMNGDVYREQLAKRRRGETESYEISWSRKDGQRSFGVVSPSPIFDENGQFRGSFAVITDITERKQAEKVLQESEEKLRYFSSQLLAAQEMERKRISRELHDELGQALTVIKLQLRSIERDLQKEKLGIWEECETLLKYTDQVIEDVRRISRDLSPSILEDLGLSAALRWLTNNFTKNYTLSEPLDLPDIDHLFPQEAQIMIYRIIQEALTNIGKHAGAQNVSLVIKKQGGRVSFIIEDDGKGFDEAKILVRDGTERGLGLASMYERVRILGGLLDVLSQEGKGTRISFSIPFQKGEKLQ